MSAAKAERLLDVGTVAERGAWSKRTVFRLNSAGKIPSPVKVGGCLRWREADIDLWIAMSCPDRRTFEAKRELQAQANLNVAVAGRRGGQ